MSAADHEVDRSPARPEDAIREALEGIRDALADLHELPGTPDGEPLIGCPGCEAQALVDSVLAALAVLLAEREEREQALREARPYVEDIARWVAAGDFTSEGERTAIDVLRRIDKVLAAGGVRSADAGSGEKTA